MKWLAPHVVASLPHKQVARSEAQEKGLAMEHVAIDLGRPNSVMCQLNAEGKKSFRRFALNRVNLDRFFGERPRCRVLIESSTESEWVARHLEGLGHEVVVADPNYAPMYGERNRRVKTDRRDADVLFEANRLGIYRHAHRRSQEQRDVTALLRVRDSLVRTRTRSINLVRALVRREGVRVRSGHAVSFVNRVEELELPLELRAEVRPMLELLGPVNEQLAAVDKQVVALKSRDERVKQLQTAPAIGAVTSAAFVALIDEVGRFPRAHALESYLGLVPSEWSSSEKRLQGRITKAGDTRVRWLLVEAGWTIMRSRRLDCQPLRSWAEGVAARRGRKVAAVALARRLAGILYAMLRDGTAYDPTCLQQGSHRRTRPAAA
jgi:transposase